MNCIVCQGRGFINRPERCIETHKIHNVWDGWAECYREEEEIIKTYVGGIDACPVCTAESEAQYEQPIYYGPGSGARHKEVSRPIRRRDETVWRHDGTKFGTIRVLDSERPRRINGCNSLFREA